MKPSRQKISNFVAQETLNQGISKRLSRELAAYLLASGRVDQLNSILRDVQEKWAQDGYVEVMASTAHPITPAIKKQITKEIKGIYPKAKRIIISQNYDPELIGGVRLNLANQQLDLSLANKLNKFRQLTLKERAS